MSESLLIWIKGRKISKVVIMEAKAHFKVRFMPNCLSVNRATIGAKGYAKGLVNTPKVIDIHDNSGFLFERKIIDRKTNRLFIASACPQYVVQKIIAGFNAKADIAMKAVLNLVFLFKKIKIKMEITIFEKIAGNFRKKSKRSSLVLKDSGENKL